jgi:ketosteroid isomerase-like protein
MFIIASAAAAAASSTADVAEVVEAERAFARAAKEKGIGPAFRAFAAPDAIVFAPDPRPAGPVLAARPERPGATLDWWPTYAGISASGDLGFTTGPFVSEHGGRKSHGHYFTVWRRQPDGSWRWVLDHGPPTREAAAAGPASPVSLLPASTTPKRGARGRWSEVVQAEMLLAQALRRDAPRALADSLADDCRVMRVGPQPAVGRRDCLAALAEGPRTIRAVHLGGAISKAGDLAFTFGRASWFKEAAPRSGHYVRIWQRRSHGWKLIVDELIASPPLPPPSPEGQ